VLVLYCISALYHDRNTVDWTRWRHKITAQRGPAPRSCIEPASARAGPALIYSVSYWQGLELCLEGYAHQIPPWRRDCMVTNRCLFRKLYYQTMPGGTFAFWMLSSDYNVLRSTATALNNFIQYSHCQVVQPFQFTHFLIKAFNTIILNISFTLALGYQTNVFVSNSSKWEQHLF